MKNPIKFLLDAYTSHEAYKNFMNKAEPRFKKFIPTNLQTAIEYSVTNGLGYERKTEYPIFSKSINNTEEGLNAHLGELEYKLNPSDDLEISVQASKYVAKEIFLEPFNTQFKPPTTIYKLEESESN